MDSSDSIKAFIGRYAHQGQLQDDDDIFAQGFVNSLFAMQLVLFIEKEFNLTIENDDLDFENFQTVNAIMRLIERKQARR